MGGRGAWRGRRDRPAKLPVRVTPWRREGDSVGAGSGVPPDSEAPGSPMGPIRSYRIHTAADARRGKTREPVRHCGALTMAREPMSCRMDPIFQSNADELENRTPIDRMMHALQSDDPACRFARVED